MRSHPAHWIALGFGSGLARRAPGTIGTLWGWVAFLVMQSFGWSDATLGGVILASLPVGWWACTVTARHLGVADPGAVVWDEVLGFWLILWLVMPAGFIGQLIAFVLFRFFDAVKPGPVAWADSRFKLRARAADGSRPRPGWRQGFGIIFDDLVAALCALLVISVWHAFH